MTSRIGLCRLFGPQARVCQWRLLNHYGLRDRRNLLLPFGFRLALLVGRVLACGDLVEGAPLRLHPDVGEWCESMARETWPAVLMITSAPAPKLTVTLNVNV